MGRRSDVSVPQRREAVLAPLRQQAHKVSGATMRWALP